MSPIIFIASIGHQSVFWTWLENTNWIKVTNALLKNKEHF